MYSPSGGLGIGVDRREQLVLTLQVLRLLPLLLPTVVPAIVHHPWLLGRLLL
jgi:hypothetical protein